MAVAVSGSVQRAAEQTHGAMTALQPWIGYDSSGVTAESQPLSSSSRMLPAECLVHHSNHKMISLPSPVYQLPACDAERTFLCNQSEMFRVG